MRQTIDADRAVEWPAVHAETHILTGTYAAKSYLPDLVDKRAPLRGIGDGPSRHVCARQAAMMRHEPATQCGRLTFENV
jgi:hypothetical protein